MATVISMLEPGDGSSNIANNAEIVLRFQDGAGFTITDIDIEVTDKNGTTLVMDQAIFQTGWTGEQIGDQFDLTVVLIRPISSSVFPEDDEITVEVLTLGGATFTFSTAAIGITSPTFSEELDLSGPGVPAGWVAVFSGTGATPTFGGTMITSTGATGTSLIRKTPYGLDLATGFLIDVDMFLSVSLPGAGAPGKVNILRVFLGGIGEVTVYVRIGNNPEIGIGTIIDEQPNDSAIPLTHSAGDVKFRLSLKGSDTTLVARLFVGFNSDTGKVETRKVLQQTLGPSNNIGTTEDLVEIGILDTDILDATFRSINILNAADPDPFYDFTNIVSVNPLNGSIEGGTRVLIVGTDINTGIIDVPFDDSTWINDLSQDGGSVSIAGNALELNTSDGGSPNNRGIARFGIPLSSDKPGGIELSFDFIVDIAFLTQLPIFNMILFGIEIRSEDKAYALELNSLITDGTKFNLISRVGNSLVDNIAGTIESITAILTNINKEIHTLRLIIANGRITTLLNGTKFNDIRIGNNSTHFTIYNKADQPVDSLLQIVNLKLLPIALFGDEPATDRISSDSDRITVLSPPIEDTGSAPITVRGTHGEDTAPNNFDYQRDPQEFKIGSSQDIDLFIIDPIIKQPFMES